MNPERENNWAARLIPLVLGLGLVACAACVYGALSDRPQFYQSYLFASYFWLGVSLGSLALVMLYHVTGGEWGAALQPLALTAARVLPLMFVLWLPLLFGAREIFPWANPNNPHAAEYLPHERAFLLPGWVILRTLVFFLIWMGLAALLYRWAQAQRGRSDPHPKCLRFLSGGGLVLFVLTGTFFSVDWIMSLEPQWYSTVFPLIFLAGVMVSALCLLIVVVSLSSSREAAAGVYTSRHLHDAGNLLLTFVMLWMYMALSQLIITWSGNLPREIVWYVHRTTGGWQYLAMFLFVAHFFTPFLLLLLRVVKRDPRALGLLAGALLLVHAVDAFWLTAPSFHPEGFQVHWLDFAAPLAVGGLWLTGFLWLLSRQPIGAETRQLLQAEKVSAAVWEGRI